MTGVSRDLAAWVAGLGWSDLPDAVRGHLALCLVDGYGCGVFGATQPWGRMTADTARAIGPGTAALFAGGGTASPMEAALANGTAIHGFEIDDVHVASSLHPAAVVIPALMALLPAAASSGRDLLTAMAAGYESGIRAGMAAGMRHSTSGFHVTGTIGTVAAGMAAARLLRLDADRTLHALGIAVTQASGLYSARKNAMTKRLHAGMAARAGVTGALLASRGFTGASQVLEADFGGLFSAMSGEHPPETILDGIGSRWETARVGFKAYASCASSHTVVDALDQLMAQGLTADNLDGLEIALGRKGLINVGWDYVPDTVVSAQMNARYVAAVKLLEGAVFVRQFRDDLLADPRVLALIARMTTRHDPDIDAQGAAKRHTVQITARLRDGTRLSARVEQRKGSAEHPLDADAICAKFRGVVGGSDIVDAGRMLAALLSIADAPDADAVLGGALRAGRPGPDQPR